MKVVCILKHIERRNQWRSKGGQGEGCMVGTCRVGGQDGSFDSPGKREPQNV